MGAQVIHDRVHPLSRARDPGLNVVKEVDPMGAAPTRIGMREGLSRRGTKRTEDVAFGAPTIIDLLPGALGWSRAGRHQRPARVALGAHWPHLVQAEDYAARRRCGVERFDPPLFSANSGSTRSPNQVSRLRQRRPSWSRISSMRLRCIAMPLASCR